VRREESDKVEKSVFKKGPRIRGNMSSQQYNPVPLLALRDIIIFPQMVVPLFVGREKKYAPLKKQNA